VTTDNFVVIDTTFRDEKQTKKRQIIAEVDWGSAFATIYPKAIYLVESLPYEVQELHFREDEEKVAYVKKVDVDYFTDAVSAKGVWILRRLDGRQHTAYLAEQGEVLVAEKVVGFKKIKMGTMENVGSGEVELPQQEKQTTSAWITVPPETLERVSRSREELIDGLRAVTYLLHHLAPIFLLCDIRDLGSWLGDTTPAETGAVATRESAKARLMQASGSTPRSTSTTPTPAASASPSACSRSSPSCCATVGIRSRRVPASSAARPASAPSTRSAAAPRRPPPASWPRSPPSARCRPSTTSAA
jgi:hypothetical protein